MPCFVCKREKLHKFLDLGQQPPSDAFLRKEDLGKPEARFPLSLYFCETCGLVQLGTVVDPTVLFTEYVYTTGMNNSLRANFKALVEKLIKRFNIGKNDFAVDIGSNDGTLLENYMGAGVKILGIDPSSAGEIAKKRGIPTLTAFFNEQTAKQVAEQQGTAKLITATNVFAHMPDVDSFMQGIKLLLRPDGVFVSESGYLLDMIETLGYDAVYHEHLRYYSLKPLQRLFEGHSMEIFDVERIPSHSGSIRVYAGHKGAHEVQVSVAKLLQEEEHAGLYKKDTFVKFGKRAHAHKEELKALLQELKLTGNRIVGIGAPAKGNTLLNFAALGPEIVDSLLEKSELKIGLYAPGTHIPVVGEELLFEEQPDFALLLSWNLADELVAKLKGKGYKGKFVIPFPQPRIIG
ncbi:MAG: class I SAM-dependent methyltransferase [bacterium]|nr:class I SAM-dependent methyltransferase [bacterium]